MIGLILVCHGNLAEALLASAREIVGDIEAVVCITNATKSPDVVRKEIADAVHSLDTSNGVLIMADLFGSSCWRCSIETARAESGVPIAVITGVNLGMLLSFSQKRAKLDFVTLASTMVEDGKRGIAPPAFFPEIKA
jgi:mannose/fructose-specific phosphotransferase system component IIA